MPSLEVEQVRQVLGNRDGIFVVTGPTGSGKTTTLYAALREIATEDVNIMTVEDPVEYELPGLTQIQVESKQGVTFASALRASLAQRRLRRVCPSCAMPVEDPLTSVERFLEKRFHVRPTVRVTGCEECAQTGYRGRLPVMEMMVMSPAVQHLVLEGAPNYVIHQQVEAEGMKTLLESALQRVRDGETTLEEVARVLTYARDLIGTGAHEARQVAFELVAGRTDVMAHLTGRDVEDLGAGNDNWASVDCCGVYVAGPAWRAGTVPDAQVRRWARSPDRWWRRTALVASVALNLKSRGGLGDPDRTLDIHVQNQGQYVALYTRVHAYFPGWRGLRLLVRRRHMFDRVWEAMGFGSLLPLNPALLERYVVKGKPEGRVPSLLTRTDFHEAIHAAESVRLAVRRPRRKIRKQYGDDTGEVVCLASGVVRDLDRLAGMIRTVVETLDALHRIGEARAEELSPIQK